LCQQSVMLTSFQFGWLLSGNEF